MNVSPVESAIVIGCGVVSIATPTSKRSPAAIGSSSAIPSVVAAELLLPSPSM